MENNETKKTSLWERNKKKIMIVGGVIIIGGISYLIFRNRNTLMKLLKIGVPAEIGTDMIKEPSIINIITDAVDLPTVVSEASKLPINGGEAFKVIEHIRNLGENRFPSAGKIAEALEKGITLGQNQTLVDSYFKNVA